jgi:hypothetical protein
MHSVGVLFVHGIGTQARGRTLADWGGVVISWIDRWLRVGEQGRIADAQCQITVREAMLTADAASEPPHAIVELRCAGQQRRTMIFAESWWAETVLPPTYGELVRWSLLVVPWTLASHFFSRLRASSGKPAALLWHFVTMLVALLAMPALLAVLAVVLILGLIPIAQVREIAVAIQRTLATTIGDSFALLHNDIQRAAIVARVERDLRWMAGTCNEIVVVAHSQGAAVAHMALNKSTGDGPKITLVTFGAGIARLLEAEQLMRGDIQRKAVPWLICLGGTLVAIGLWGSLPAFWELRWQFAQAGAIYIGGIALVYIVMSAMETLFGVTPPKWVQLLVMPAFIPMLVVMWRLFDRSPLVFSLIGAQYAIGAGFAWNTDSSSSRTVEANVSSWLDFHASRDPVSNGPLFGPEGDKRSVEVWNQRSIVADHTTYWTSLDDFVAQVACLVTAKAGVTLDRDPDDQLRLEKARARRRWRTAWLAGVRMAVLASPLLIVGSRGLSSAFSATDSGALFQLQRSTTEAVADLISDVTPDFVKGRVSNPPAAFPTSPAVLSSSSLILLLLVTGGALLLVTWRWRVWDRAETARLFQRKDVALLEPQFVVFLLTTAAIVELVAFAAAGWLAGLRSAHPSMLKALGGQLMIPAALAASPWLARFLYFLIFDNTLLGRTARRAAAAGAVAALVVLPLLVWAGSHFPVGGFSEFGDVVPIEAASSLGLTTVFVIWLVPRVWRYVEPKLSSLVEAGPIGRPKVNRA